MKKNNRKGFTIVELVIVIAVIAILATVLVPTFGNVIADAKNTALVQQIKNEHTNYTMKYATADGYTENIAIKIGDKYYEFEDGTIVMNDDDEPVAMETAPHTFYDAENNELDTNCDTTGEGGKCSVCGATN